ncbi:efflux RND transporter periplasmic adaptor subunit [Geminisphaera colitermitum]|uniref:efflux RND transporter periplasmic adaptor subunit n=1 Tax=Geminisphaera colitermitum TaxID=1148786 RepID=UPI000158D01F|nr:efflux RND transporter periplasmic adaptor subunit [Geminisphaera colitermitum]
MPSNHTVLVLLALAGPLFVAGCGKRKDSAVASAAPAAVEVGVVTLGTASTAQTRELPGRTAAHRVAQVRARVNGIILKRLFVEGADVKEGELLYQIDPAPYQAILDSAKASLARAESNLKTATLQAGRYKELVAVNAVSKQQYDDAVAAVGAYAADMASARAAITSAGIDLGYTKVTSPIAGRIGLSEVTEGAYVQAGQATLMATVQQLDPIYVNLVQPSAEVSRLKRAIEKGVLQAGAEKGQTPVQLILEDGTAYDHTGALQFSDVTVDRTTGSVTLRVLFPNPSGDLLPGMFVRARFDEGINPRTLLAPQQGVSRNYRGLPTAWIVTADNKAENRVIETGRTHGDQWIVTGGLQAGDRIIVTNIQRIRGGTTVAPVPWTPGEKAVTSENDSLPRLKN